MYETILYKKTHKIIHKTLLLLLIGLGFTHHHTFILFIPGLIVVFYKEVKNNLHIKSVVKSLLLVLAPFTIYSYSIIASIFNPPIDWENSKTISGLIRMFGRLSYGGIKPYASSVPSMINQYLSMFMSLLISIWDFRIIGAIFIILGLIYLHKTKRWIAYYFYITIGLYLTFLFILNFPLNNSFGMATSERFLIAFYLLLIIPFAAGVAYLFSILRIGTKFKNSIFFITLGFILVFHFFISLKTVKYVPKIKNFDYLAQDILKTPSRNSIMTLSADNTLFTVSYYYFVKKIRNDVRFIFLGLTSRQYYRDRVASTYPNINIKCKTPKEFVKNNSSYNIFSDAPLKNAGLWVPYGLLWKYYPDKKDLNKDMNKIIKTNEKFWKTYHIPRLTNQETEIVHLKSLQDYYLDKLMYYIYFLFTQNRMKLAFEKIELVLDVNPKFSPILRLIDNMIENTSCSKLSKNTYLKENRLPKLAKIIFSKCKHR